MNPAVVLFAMKALKAFAASKVLAPHLVGIVQALKTDHKEHAEIQALPDDAAAIAKWAKNVEEGLAENKGIQERLKARKARGE